MSDDEDKVQVIVKVPKSVRDAAKEKLEHGGMSRELRDTLTRIAFGEDLNQRSRLERTRDELQNRINELRAKRRELDTEIDNLEMRREGINEKLTNVTTREDKFEAKLESLENRLLNEGQRLFETHAAVIEAAQTGAVETEQVIAMLKERNEEVPEYAFQEAFKDRQTWNGLSKDQRDID